jgi:hypothetical protein
MNTLSVLRSIQKIKNDLQKSEYRLSELVGLLSEEEVIKELKNRRSVSTGWIQIQFKLGYVSASTIIDSLVKKSLVTQIGTSLRYSINKKLKR